MSEPQGRREAGACEGSSREEAAASISGRKKLIEVALPLAAISEHAAREKAIRQGHPSTLHLWWARRPLAAARAVLFAQLVDDPAVPEEFPTVKRKPANESVSFS